jgi:type I restriction enzyme R subunit
MVSPPGGSEPETNRKLTLRGFRRTLATIMLIVGIEAEWLTRKLRIDRRLRSLNPPWPIIPWHAGLDTSKFNCHAVAEFPTEDGPADYALFLDGVLLGILEAKKVSVNPQNVLEQAKSYSRGAANSPGIWNGFCVPFVYATDGEIIWHLDVRSDKPVSRPLADSHTAAALAEKFAFDDRPSRQWLLDKQAVARFANVDRAFAQSLSRRRN